MSISRQLCMYCSALWNSLNAIVQTVASGEATEGLKCHKFPNPVQWCLTKYRVGYLLDGKVSPVPPWSISWVRFTFAWENQHGTVCSFTCRLFDPRLGAGAI